MVLADAAKSTPGKLEACAGKKIYIMDIGMFAKENGVPPCNLATVGFLLQSQQCSHMRRSCVLNRIYSVSHRDLVIQMVLQPRNVSTSEMSWRLEVFMPSRVPHVSSVLCKLF